MAKKKKKQLKKAARKTHQKKNTSVVITSPVDPSSRIIMASEIADDEMIESELMGQVLPYYIYQFCDNRPACKEMEKCTHRKTTGMSVKGVNEVVRRLNRDSKSGYKIRINPNFLKIERDVEENGQKGVSVSVYAENLIDGNSAWGIKFEPYMKTGKNGAYANTFAGEKALSKAERNAKRKLMPEVVAMKMIQKIITKNPETVKTIQEAPASVVVIAAPVQPVPSTPEDIKRTIIAAIHQAKSVDLLIELDSKTKGSPNFDAGFKEMVHTLCSKRADEISTK